jgi:crotonyl-CoA carboxylase/reductase
MNSAEVFSWEQIPKALRRMLEYEHKPGIRTVLVNAPHTVLRAFEDVLEASAKRFG